jgi:hypothetical protein
LRLGSVAGPVIQATGRSEFEVGLGSGDFVSGNSYHMNVRTIVVSRRDIPYGPINLQKFAKICKNLQKFAKICKNLHTFISLTRNVSGLTNVSVPISANI